MIRLSALSRFIPRLCPSAFYSTAAGSPTPVFNSALKERKEVKDVEHLEEQLFGRYYGATDSSNFEEKKYSRKSEFRRRPVSRNIKEEKETTPDPWGITTLRLHDPTLSRLILDARNPKKLKKQQRMILEGKRLIKDALLAGLRPLDLVVSDASLLGPFEQYREAHFQKCSVYKVPLKDLSIWSSLTTCPGILAVFERPKAVQPDENCLPITVICDNVREPSNLGSIFRVAAALPCRQVVVIKGCADPWEVKCLRGGSGGQFHIPIEYPVTWEEVPDVISVNNSEIFVAENEGKDKTLKVRTIYEPLVEGATNKDIIVVIGGETHGISDEAYEFVKASGVEGSVVNIPIAAAIDSLNTASALAVILFEFRRQILHQMATGETTV